MELCNFRHSSEFDIAMSARIDPETGKTVYNNGLCKLDAGHEGGHDVRNR